MDPQFEVGAYNHRERATGGKYWLVSTVCQHEKGLNFENIYSRK